MRRFLVPALIFVIMATALVFIAISGSGRRSDLTSVVELWGDAFRDLNSLGLSVTRVSDEQEMSFGSTLAKQLDNFATSDEGLNAYVSDIGQALVQNVRRRRIRYRFSVIDGPANAFALPGGQVFITTGMLEFARSEAEIAAVLAHEIAHVDLRHAIEQAQYELLLRRIAPGALVDMTRVPQTLLFLAYSEQMEREADRNSVLLMAAAGYHPKYAVELFNRELTAYEAEPPPPRTLTGELAQGIHEALISYLRTHPSDRSRVDETARTLVRNGPRWAGEAFYVGRANHQQRRSRRRLEEQTELRPFAEPPAFHDYLNGPGLTPHKAIAAHPFSGLSGIAYGQKDPETAAKAALEACQRKTSGCSVYAIDDAIAGDKKAPVQKDQARPG